MDDLTSRALSAVRSKTFQDLEHVRIFANGFQHHLLVVVLAPARPLLLLLLAAATAAAVFDVFQHGLVPINLSFCLTQEVSHNHLYLI